MAVAGSALLGPDEEQRPFTFDGAGVAAGHSCCGGRQIEAPVLPGGVLSALGLLEAVAAAVAAAGAAAAGAAAGGAGAGWRCQVNSLDDMRRFILEHSDFNRAQSNVTKHVNIVDTQLSEEISRRSLMDVSTVSHYTARRMLAVHCHGVVVA